MVYRWSLGFCVVYFHSMHGIAYYISLVENGLCRE